MAKIVRTMWGIKLRKGNYPGTSSWVRFGDDKLIGGDYPDEEPICLLRTRKAARDVTRGYDSFPVKLRVTIEDA